MQLLRGLIAAGIQNRVHANLLMFCILAGGAISARSMIREVYPEFSADHIAVEVAYPGASTADVERAICTPIEEAVTGISGVFEISASAQEDFGIVWLALITGVADTQYVLDEVKARVDQIFTFPSEARKPVVREVVIRRAVTNVALFGPVRERSLKRLAQDVRDDLMTNPEISQIQLSGIREDEIVVEVSRDALTAYNLSLQQVMSAISENVLDLPAGVIRTSQEEYTLRTSGRRYAASDYEDIVVFDHGDESIRIRDIGTVSEGFEETVVHGEFNGEPAAVVQVFKTPDEDASEIARIVREYVASRQGDLPERLHMSVWADTSHDIDGRIAMLVENGLWGVVLVFLTLTMFVELRLAFWVAIGIPVAFAGALIMIHASGQTLNMLSLFALIMVSGFIVDDAIVIAESVNTRQRAGDTPQLASIEGTSRVALPVLGASLTTIAAFIPLLFVAGVMGRFIYVLPVVVIAAIIASTIESFGILPSHLCHRGSSDGQGTTRPPNRLRRGIDRMIEHVITRWYRPLYRKAIRARLATVCGALGLFFVAGGVVLGHHIPFILMPLDDGNTLRARIRFLEGTPISVTNQAVERITSAAWELNDNRDLVPATKGDLVRQVYAVTGEFDDFRPFRGNHLGEVRMELMPAELRGIPDEEIIEQWSRNIGIIHDVLRMTIRGNPLGPLANPIEFRLLGHDLDDLKAASNRIQAKLREYDGLFNVEDDLLPGKRELIVQLNPSARGLGVTLNMVAKQLRYGFYGGEAVRLQRGRDRVTVRVRFPESERRSVTDLENMHIQAPAGHEVLFSEVGDVRWDRGHSYIMHQNGKRRVRVFADVDDRRANAHRIVAELDRGFLGDVVNDYNDLTYVIAGNRAYMNESMSSLFSGFLVAMVAIYTMLGWMLHSYTQPLAILLAVPFGLIGVVTGHAILGFDLTLMSMFGAVALSGVVVNDSLVLLDAVNRGIREGMGMRRAVLRAGELRFRAVTLTSITTIAGLMPILLEPSSQAQAVKPMAVSLGFGLLFATVLTLFVVPASYLLLSDVRRFMYWLWHGGSYPATELVRSV